MISLIGAGLAWALDRAGLLPAPVVPITRAARCPECGEWGGREPCTPDKLTATGAAWPCETCTDAEAIRAVGF